MELIKFIFSSFWVFCGFVILIHTIATGITMIISSIIATIKGADVSINLFSNISANTDEVQNEM